MMKRFSKHELFKLRNSISINMLINEILKLPSKTSQGQLRFLCPLCSQFNTATKRETNLARCFHCQRNFNTIEMVMETKNLDFIQSAQFLQGLLRENKSKEITANKPSSNPRLPCPDSFQTRKESVSLQTLVKNIGIKTSKQLNQTSNDDSAKINRQDQVIETLNDKINRLEKELDQLKSFVIEQFVEKSKSTRY
tara:strand:- start:198 stop:782 length:585 start_codon:yes stop_codon:yes gene_type:complete